MFVTLGTLGLHGYEADTGVKWTTSRDQFTVLSGAGSSLQLTQKTRQHGANSGDAFLTPNHIGLGGLIQAPSEAALWDARNRLLHACTLTDTLLTIQTPLGERWTTVRREDVPIVTLLSPTKAAWSIQVVAPDPRWFATTLRGESHLPVTSGGLLVPFTVPFFIDSVVDSGQVSLVNTGNVRGPVRLRIDGPVTGPVVTHVSSGLALVFASSLTLSAGEWVDVDMEKHTVLANGQASRAKWVTSRGWSGFEPGDNTWAFSAQGYSPDARLTVLATPAWE